MNDALDYFGPDHVGQGCGLRPYTVPCVPGGPENALTAVTFGLTLFGVLVLAWVTWPRRGHPADATTE